MKKVTKLGLSRGRYSDRYAAKLWCRQIRKGESNGALEEGPSERTVDFSAGELRSNQLTVIRGIDTLETRSDPPAKAIGSRGPTSHR